MSIITGKDIIDRFNHLSKIGSNHKEIIDDINKLKRNLHEALNERQDSNYIVEDVDEYIDSTEQQIHELQEELENNTLTEDEQEEFLYLSRHIGNITKYTTLYDDEKLEEHIKDYISERYELCRYIVDYIDWDKLIENQRQYYTEIEFDDSVFYY